MKNGRFQQREIEVMGTEERRVVFSPDGRNWWSDLREYARYQRRRATLAKQLKGTARRETTLEKL